MSVYLPIMLDCRGRRCVVIGGGAVAERKVAGLLEAEAAVVVISPSLTEPLAELAAQGLLDYQQRRYAPGDAGGAYLLYAASDDIAVNEAAAAEAKHLGIPVNVASHAEAGSFITPGVIRRGRLTVAVSTSGAGPAAAKHIKETLEEVLGAELEPYLDWVHAMRMEIKRTVPSPEMRGRLLRKLASLDTLTQMRQETFTEWTPAAIASWIAENSRGNLGLETE
ncbi:siroheme synthase [Paenibacillus donghaensis]|uniref:precorrin-2 dehydrogenase n=1 Tax=Paenibacillus donghaensis TaxID=414771 RepID=A0A2Z2KKC2_9BACL|nr:siroheme synthase [Paenibacillus donghaensis]